MQGFYAILMKLTIKHAFVCLKGCQKILVLRAYMQMRKYKTKWRKET